MNLEKMSCFSYGLLKALRERMEDTASEHFNSLEKMGFFVFSRCDFTMDFNSFLSAPTENPSNLLYKVNPCKNSLLEETISSGTYFKAVDGKLDVASEMTRPLSLISEVIDGMTNGILQKFKHLRTLHMISCSGSSMRQVPRDLCFTLMFLKTLNLSGTLISELPSSIGNVKSLRYIDASHTQIARLPESIDSLCNLQTIKLRGCKYFVQLPKGIKRLSNLSHIDLDIIRQLDSIPGHLGNLMNLQTLPAFLVGRDDGCRIGELKNLNDLKGSFNISRLENVLSKEEAVEAALIDKKWIHRLELRWNDVFIEYGQQEEILECLQSHSGLKELQIQQNSGSILPAWISSPSFADLVVITLYRCRNCVILPCMGQLPALKFLSIIEVNEVKEINHRFLRMVGVNHAFPKLESLEIDIMLSLKLWENMQVGDLPSLVKLTLDCCPELVSLPALMWLTSLKHLELRCRPKLMTLPTGGLPTSLEFFLLLDCLQPKEWCLKSEYRSMLCHVPSIWFDHEEIKVNDNLANAHSWPLPPGAAEQPQLPTVVMHQNVAPTLPVSLMKGQWQKGKLIGRDTFGSVFLATNRETGAMCAMKDVDIIPDDPKSAENIKQLEQEIEVLCTLKHPNIVQYFGSEVIDDHFYISLEYVHPGSNKYVRDYFEGAMTEPVVRNFTQHILCGLAFLHDTKTIHRDIKGANLLVDASGVVKLADIGMAKLLSANSYHLSLKSSPYWMAPEVIRAGFQNDGDPNLPLAVDTRSLGCTVIEMFNGKPPWNEFEGPQAMFKVLNRTLDIPEKLSAEGKDFLNLCFKRNPAERPSARKLLDHPFVQSSNDQTVLSYNSNDQILSYTRAFSLGTVQIRIYLLIFC